MDLDPAQGATFSDVLEIALLVRKALDELKLKSFAKTSGASGLHLFIPIKPVYSWPSVTKAMKYVAELIVRVHPDKATTERKVDQREGKVYLDYLQNGRGKTMAFQYGLRPLPGAPVSTPLVGGGGGVPYPARGLNNGDHFPPAQGKRGYLRGGPHVEAIARGVNSAFVGLIRRLFWDPTE